MSTTATALDLASTSSEAQALETEELPFVTLEELPRATFRLRIVAGPDAGLALALDATPHAIVGKGEEATVRLADPHVSRRHLALTVTATHLHLVDLGSRNGTRVNGALVREARLYGGETVTLGATTFGIETERAMAANALESGTLPPAPPSIPAPPSLPTPSAGDFFAEMLAEQLPFTDARQRTIAEFERRYVADCLARHNGNVTHAARASGLAHRYFQLLRARTR